MPYKYSTSLYTHYLPSAVLITLVTELWLSFGFHLQLSSTTTVSIVSIQNWSSFEYGVTANITAFQNVSSYAVARGSIPRTRIFFAVIMRGKHIPNEIFGEEPPFYHFYLIQ